MTTSHNPSFSSHSPEAPEGTFAGGTTSLPGGLFVGFGERLKLARHTRGLSGPQLAAELGLDRSAIPQYESERSTPSLAVAKNLAAILGVSLDWLVFGEEAPNVEIHDKELASFFSRVDRLDFHKRAMVKVILDGVLARQELDDLRRDKEPREQAA